MHIRRIQSRNQAHPLASRAMENLPRIVQHTLLIFKKHGNLSLEIPAQKLGIISFNLATQDEHG